MDKLVEQQREHFNKISQQYFGARTDSNHLLLKSLIWQAFFQRHPQLGDEVARVLEPMCGMAEGYRVLRLYMKPSFEYYGFDYSENMVEIARRANPGISLGHGDVTKYRPLGEPNDLIVLIGGLHHVFSHTREVVARLAQGLRPGGYFLSFEPTHDNWVARKVRQKIYRSNDIFDEDTEQGFEYRDLRAHFEASGFDLIDEIFPGLLAYVLYYNPDAFPSLNVGGASLVKFLFAIDRQFWANAIGRKLSFATIGLWRRK